MPRTAERGATRRRVAQLTAEKKKPAEIAAILEITEAAVYYHLKHLQAEQPQGEPRPGIWTPEKLEKAHRLFGKTMILIADALQVPPKELLEYGLKGVMPPMGKSQRIAALLDHMPAPDDVERDQDEAELAALEQEADDEDEPDDSDGTDGGSGPSDFGRPAPVVSPLAEALRVRARGVVRASEDEDEEEAPSEAEPESSPATEGIRRYRLTDGAGRYRLEDVTKGMTLNRALAWCGTAAEMEKLFKRHPELKELDPERVPG